MIRSCGLGRQVSDFIRLGFAGVHSNDVASMRISTLITAIATIDINVIVEERSFLRIVVDYGNSMIDWDY